MNFDEEDYFADGTEEGNVEEHNMYRFIHYCIDPKRIEFIKPLNKNLNRTLIINLKMNKKINVSASDIYVVGYVRRKSVMKKVLIINKAKLQPNCVLHIRFQSVQNVMSHFITRGVYNYQCA